MSRWFRFYDTALDDPKVQRLPAALFKTWVNLLCVASRNDGRLPVADLAFSLRLDDDTCAEHVARLKDAGLIDEADGELSPHNWNGRQFTSDSSAERVKKHRDKKRNADSNVTPAVTATPPETETETETERELVSTNSPRAPRAPIAEAVELWNETADRAGFPRAQTVNDRRRTAIKARLAECGGLDGWKFALAKAEASSFCRGAGSSGWVMDLDAFTQAKTFMKLMEGSYDDRPQSRTYSVQDQFARAFERLDSHIDALD